ncbi:MAG: DUF1207 domain-containing protein [Calditrichaeota bacterium]|nr:MAG: DUF1207 domain-containing protein [Calditrichota bacterium]
MRISSFFFVFLIFFSITATAQDGSSSLENLRSRSYFLQDFQYFKPLLADIRSPHNHSRFYQADAVRFSNNDEGRDDTGHIFFDPSFGEYFPFLGFNFAEEDPDKAMNLPGLALFIAGSAHMMLDFYTVSNDVINTDYRVGVGAAMRFPIIHKLSARYRYFHESTHLGDEYTLSASLDPDFRRYNVSYEASELYLALDHYIHDPGHWGYFSYGRIYGGQRWLNNDSFAGHTGMYGDAEPLLLAEKTELELGVEIVLQGWEAPDKNPDWGWLRRLLAPQFIFAAGDFQKSNKYAVDDPQQEWSNNIVLGIIYGKYFALKGERTVRWQLNFYDGINPHGQFRMEDLSYLGLDYIIDF